MTKCEKRRRAPPNDQRSQTLCLEISPPSDLSQGGINQINANTALPKEEYKMEKRKEEEQTRRSGDGGIGINRLTER